MSMVGTERCALKGGASCFRSVATALAVLVIDAGRALGQTGAPAAQPPGMVVLHYNRGRIQEEYLPYSHTFQIVGPRATIAGQADVVYLAVYPDRRKDPKPGLTTVPDATSALDSSCWIARLLTDTASTFSLTVRPLGVGNAYALGFVFGRPFSPDVAQQATDLATARVVQEYRTRAPGQREVGQFVLGAFTQALREVSGDQPLWVHVTGEGSCTVDTVAPRLMLTESQQRIVADSIQNSGARAAVRDSAINQQTKALLEIESINQVGLDQVAAHLRSAFLALPLKERRGALDTAAVGALMRAVRSRGQILLDTSAWNRLNAVLLQPRRPPPLTQPDLDLLQKTLSALDNLRNARNEADIARLAAARADTVARTAVKTAIAAAASRDYRVVATADTRGTAWGAAAEVRKLQIGTAVGGGGAWLAPGQSGGRGDGFGFATLRYYLAPVDRSLPDPWSSPLAHWSIDVGALLKSSLAYRGQTLDDALLGFKPVVGMSFDLKRYLAASFGLVVFRQASVNPANGGATKSLHSAPYFGVSTDFDALNQLRDLIK